MSTPDLYLETSFIRDDEGRIMSTREPGATRGPLISIVRSATSCAWAIRAGLSRRLGGELNELAQQEPPTADLRDPPVHADRYLSLVRGHVGSHEAALKTRQSDGPAFTFPAALVWPADIVAVEDERLLERNFRGWVPGEIADGRAPVLAIVEDGYPVSVCFCARRSDAASEAGVDTAPAFRGRGFGPRVTTAWALAIRATGRVPLYSTAWTNEASLSVARRLGLVAYASSWSLSD
ncbi:MAG: GNAT family N-acetyltransferase [Gemmatimonadaceae bacterium]